MAESSLEGRHRRTNPKRRREEIYCYDVEDRLKAKTEELDSEEVEAVSEEDEDDSFIYGSLRGRKS